jgi:hypothetical protein
VQVRNQIASTAKGYRRSLTQDVQPFTPLSSPGAVVISPAVPAVITFTSAESNSDVAVYDGAAATAAAAALAGIPTAAKVRPIHVHSCKRRRADVLRNYVGYLWAVTQHPVQGSL